MSETTIDSFLQSPDYRRDYLVRIPLPLAQLYVRAYNAKDAHGRHDNCFYLFECLIKCAASPPVAAYVADVRAGGTRHETLDRLLTQIALPSLGQWLGFLRETARYFSERSDAAVHPLGSLWSQLTTKRQDLPGALELYRRIKNGPDGKPSGAKSVSLLELFDSLVQYRNIVFGHGASRVDDFYEFEMGPLLFPAVNDVLAAGVLDLCGPDGSRLAFVRDVRRVERDLFEVDASALVGLHSERLSPIRVEASHAEELIPGRVFLFWQGTSVPLSMDPLMVFREDGVNEELLILNRDRNGKKVEYLSYTTGKTERTREMADALREMLAVVVGSSVSREDLKEMTNRTRAAEPAAKEETGSDETAGVRIGDFEILAELGRGGMGVVYLARQLALGRTVALKMLPAGTTSDPAARARFQREVTALARCDSPNIVRILFSGQTQTGQPYYAMEYVPGATLEQTWRELSGTTTTSDVSSLNSTVWANALLTASQKSRDEAWERIFAADQISDPEGDSLLDNSIESIEDLTSIGGRETLSRFGIPRIPEIVDLDEDAEGYSRRVARIIRDAARAASVLHANGIVHRDIKPANLVLSPDGQRVILMDFGLVKGDVLGGAAVSTGGFLGTLRYAAPEQLASASVEVGPPADVRAIGVMLWELLTRHRLFDDAQDENQLAQAVLERDVPLLQSVDAGFDDDLQAIVARATDRSASGRIQTAKELASHLDDYLAFRPVSVRVPGPVERSRRWLSQNKNRFGIGAIIATAVIAIAVAVSSFRNADEMLSHEPMDFTPPRGLRAVPVPSDNLLTPARIELGQMLFYDKRLSLHDDMSCATCHQTELGYTAGASKMTTRNAQSVVNVSYFDELFRDGRADDLESHALMPILNPLEMQMPDVATLEEKLRAIPGYRDAFRDAYRSEITGQVVAQAIAAFERTLVAANSPFDRFYEEVQAGPGESPWTTQMEHGWKVFQDLDCTLCHEPPLFSDGRYYNMGIGHHKEPGQRDAGRSAVARSPRPEHRHAFRTPSLRDLERTAPYMHDGSLTTIEEVVDYLLSGGSEDPNSHAWLKQERNITSDDRSALIEFLRHGLASDTYPTTSAPELPE